MDPKSTSPSHGVESSEMTRLPVEELLSQAMSLVAKFAQGGGESLLDDAIALDRQALELCPLGHHNRSDCLTQLSSDLNGRFKKLKRMGDLDEAIVLERDVIALCPPGHPNRLTCLGILASRLSTRYDQLGAVEDINEAVLLGQDALTLCPSGHPRRAISLYNLAVYLSDRYNKLGEMKDIQQAIDLGRDALALRPPGHPDRSMSLDALAAGLSIRYDQVGDMEDLSEAILLGRGALALRPPGDPGRSGPLNNLAARLFTLYNRLGVMKDLDEAIRFGRDALMLCPPGHPERSTSLNNLAIGLSTRYKQLGNMEDLNEAILLNREALALHPPGDPDRPMSLGNLASCLSTRYNKVGEMKDLDEAIVLDREAFELRPPGHPDRSMSLNNLAIRLSIRYNQLGCAEDLDEAILLDRDALVLHPVGHPVRHMSLYNLAAHLTARHGKFGEMSDLNEAIVLGRDALALHPPGHPQRSTSLNGLAVNLSTRYDQLGTIEDLDEAILWGREGLKLRSLGHLDHLTEDPNQATDGGAPALPQTGHPHRPISLINLAALLSTRYKRFGKAEDIDDSIVLGRDALALCPPGHPDRSMSLDSLATHLTTRYKRLRGIEDLDEAIILSREALALRPSGHPARSISLHNLAIHLSTRYTQNEAAEDLNEAILLVRDALALCPPGHPLRSKSLSILASHFLVRFLFSGQSEDKDEMFRTYTMLAHVPQMGYSDDISVTTEWIRAAEAFQHSTTLLAYETSLRLLIHHLAALPSLPQHLGLFRGLTSSLAVDAFSACLRNRSPARAVELLEQGRAVFWSQLTRLRSPLDDVIASGPVGEVLADEFVQLTLRLRNALNSSRPDQHDRVCNLNVELEKVVANIRKLPGLSRFLLPSLFSDLQQVAREGPLIIVNASKYSCDALIVLFDRDPVHIPLLITKEGVRELSSKLRTLIVRAKRTDVTKELYICLRKIWDDVVSPIVDFLRTVHPLRSRIWWCPTAEFSLLPLHAAGPFRKGQRKLADLYTSSYTTTLVALIRARQHKPSRSTTDVKRFVAIGQATAVGQNELASVGSELANIGQCVSGLAAYTRIEGAESSITRVAEELGKSDWVHFACHGIPNPKQPFESAFVLHDGRFTIQQIIQCNPENPEFAYLSACHTTVGDEESPDEVIHLASAMQFAGFRSIIGTMWAVDDAETNKFTSSFYNNIKSDESARLDHTRAAFALSKTIKKLPTDVPLDQRILYVHLGA